MDNMFKYISNFSKRILAANQDGPPDLDELFKDLKNKMNRVIGGRLQVAETMVKSQIAQDHN